MLPSFSAKLLARHRPPCVLVDDRLDAAAPTLLYADPESVVRCDDAKGIAVALGQIEAGRKMGCFPAYFAELCSKAAKRSSRT
jgi:hypothetical protein